MASPTAAIATIKKHRGVNAGKHLVWLGEQIQSGWERLAKKHDLPICVSSIKPLSHFTFQHEDALYLKAYFVQLMLEQGFLASNLYYAMYAHKEEHIDKYLQSVDKAFVKIAQAIDKGDVKDNLLGRPSNIGFERLA